MTEPQPRHATMIKTPGFRHWEAQHGGQKGLNTLLHIDYKAHDIVNKVALNNRTGNVLYLIVPARVLFSVICTHKLFLINEFATTLIKNVISNNNTNKKGPWQTVCGNSD